MIKHLWRWHPEVALRYLPVVKKIKNNFKDNPAVLEIGCGSLGIAPYYEKPITGIDINFSGPQIDLLTKIRGSATNLLVKDRSYDITLLIDVLEHIPANQREKVIEEAVRVTKHLLVIASPTERFSKSEDLYLANYYQKVFKKSFLFLEEHLKFGLPKEKFIEKTVFEKSKELKRKIIKVETEGNINLYLHRFLMKGWITKNFIIDIIFRKVFLFLIPILMFFNQEPTYRKIFYFKFRE